MKSLKEIMTVWTTKFQVAALAEGWGLFEEGEKLEVQMDDEANKLASDEQAKMMVRTGTGEHHSVARKIIHDHFPEEWKALEDATLAQIRSIDPNYSKIEAACAVAVLEQAQPNSLGNIPGALLEKIEEQWLQRARIQGFGKPASQAYKKAEGEYFIGAMTVFCTIGFVAPPRWVIAIMQNDNIVKEKK